MSTWILRCWQLLQSISNSHFCGFSVVVEFGLKVLSGISFFSKYSNCGRSYVQFKAFDKSFIKYQLFITEGEQERGKGIPVMQGTWGMFIRIQGNLLKASDFAPVSSKEFLGIKATIECGFTLKRVRDMIRTYSQMHRTDKFSQHSSIIWPVWLNGWVFVYELSGCEFESRCSHLNFGECSRIFQRMFQKIPGNTRKYSLQIFWGMLSEILEKIKFRLISWSFAWFYQILLLNCYKTIENNNCWVILLK